MNHIMMIEDNGELGQLICDFLKRENIRVSWFTTGEKGLKALEEENFDLVLLDIMLPGLDGFQICNRIRKEKDIPILMMSARNDDRSKLLGYEIGADDYIEKPFSIQVLVAKLRALMRRSYEIKTKETTLSSDGITLDIGQRKVFLRKKEVDVRGKSFDVLYYLMKHKGEVVEKNKLFNEIWGADCFSEPGTLNVHIRWLREALEEDPGNPKLIRTVWKVGYQFGDKA